MFNSLNIMSVERLPSGTYIFHFHGCFCALDISACGHIWEVWDCGRHIWRS